MQLASSPNILKAPKDVVNEPDVAVSIEQLRLGAPPGLHGRLTIATVICFILVIVAYRCLVLGLPVSEE